MVAAGQRAIFTAANMSLIRSLLPLAALLAIATAGDRCIVKIFGTMTNHLVPLTQVTVLPPGGELDVPIDECKKHGYPDDAVGEYVKVCNLDSDTTPFVDEKEHGKLTPLVVTCTNCSPDGVTVDIVLYCP